MGLATRFDAFAAGLRRELAPASRLEDVLADRAVLAAYRLHLISLDESDAARDGDDLPLIRREALRAECSLETALALLAAARRGRRGHAAEDAEPLPDLSNEWPVLPEPVVPGRWQGRLVFDPNVSETSPVVKGTWVTVGHVVSLIVDGWAWPDVLRTHPELTEEDIRTCLAYTVEQDGYGE